MPLFCWSMHLVEPQALYGCVTAACGASATSKTCPWIFGGCTCSKYRQSVTKGPGGDYPPCRRRRCLGGYAPRLQSRCVQIHGIPSAPPPAPLRPLPPLISPTVEHRWNITEHSTINQLTNYTGPFVTLKPPMGYSVLPNKLFVKKTCPCISVPDVTLCTRITIS